jgi:hypothetical protein
VYELHSQVSCISNVAVRYCDFVFRDGTNGTFPPDKRFITNTNITTTVTNCPVGRVGFLVRVCNVDQAQNIVMQDCTYNGNPGLTNVNTEYAVDAGDGLAWFQQGGNWFIGRCAITNYALEGVNLNAGPCAVTGNEFHTQVSVTATVAFHGVAYWKTPTGNSNDYTFYMVANNITGGREGFKGAPYSWPDLKTNRLHISGNALGLLPAFPRQDDYPGAAVGPALASESFITGNRMTGGDHAIRWLDGCANAVVLKNDFSGAGYRGLVYDGTNGVAHHISILRNTIGQGKAFHLKTPSQDPGSFLLDGNVFLDGAATVNPFIDPPSSPVHIRY